MIWLFRSPPSMAWMASEGSRALFSASSTQRRTISISASSQLFWLNRSSSSTVSNHSASGPSPSLGPAMLAWAAITGGCSYRKVCAPAWLTAPTP